MRKMLSAALLMCMVALLTLLIPAGYATKPIPVSGNVDYNFEPTGMREADGNMFLYAIEYENWTGAFEGKAEAVFRVEMFRSGFWNVWLRSTFDGTVNSKSGTAVIQLVGKKPEGEDWYGQWVILSGTGELADLRGRGTWGGPGFGAVGPDLWYEGKIHSK